MPLLGSCRFTHKHSIDNVNRQKLAALPGPAVHFVAKDSSSQGRSGAAALRQLQRSCPARAELDLKAGAQVILLKTLCVEKGLVNGSRGVIESFNSRGQPVVSAGPGPHPIGPPTCHPLNASLSLECSAVWSPDCSSNLGAQRLWMPGCSSHLDPMLQVRFLSDLSNLVTVRAVEFTIKVRTPAPTNNCSPLQPALWCLVLGLGLTPRVVCRARMVRRSRGGSSRSSSATPSRSTDRRG